MTNDSVYSILDLMRLAFNSNKIDNYHMSDAQKTVTTTRERREDGM